MLRALVAALAIANLLMLVWWLGWLDWAPGVGHDREPERLAAQVNPNAIQLIAPGADAASAALQEARVPPPAASAPAAAAAAEPAASSPAERERAACLEAGPFATGEVAAAERALRELQWSNLAWIQLKSERGGAFIVYQGRFADDAALAKRREELRRAQIPFDELRNSPDLMPGLSLGRFDSRAAADTALDELRQRGAKSTRVVTISPPVAVTLLRVERADPALATRLAQLTLPPAGSGFRPCATPP